MRTVDHRRSRRSTLPSSDRGTVVERFRTGQLRPRLRPTSSWGSRLKRLRLIALVAPGRACARFGSRPGRTRRAAPSPLRALHREQPDVDERPSRVRRGDREGVQAEDRVPHDRAERRDPPGQLEQGSAREALLGGRWDAVVLQQGPSVLPREPREPLLLRQGLRRRGARVGCAAVPAHGVAAARRGVAEVIDARSAAAAGAETGCCRAAPRGRCAATGAGPPALPVGRHPPGTGGDVPRRAGRLRGAARRRARRAELLVVNGNPLWIPRDTARLLRDSAREALSMRFSTPACSQL